MADKPLLMWTGEKKRERTELTHTPHPLIIYFRFKALWLVVTTISHPVAHGQGLHSARAFENLY
jgi:hypothetical protein